MRVVWVLAEHKYKYYDAEYISYIYHAPEKHNHQSDKKGLFICKEHLASVWNCWGQNEHERSKATRQVKQINPSQLDEIFAHMIKECSWRMKNSYDLYKYL